MTLVMRNPCSLSSKDEYSILFSYRVKDSLFQRIDLNHWFIWYYILKFNVY